MWYMIVLTHIDAIVLGKKHVLNEITVMNERMSG
jgi:hypothetical protein